MVKLRADAVRPFLILIGLSVVPRSCFCTGQRWNTVTTLKIRMWCSHERMGPLMFLLLMVDQYCGHLTEDEGSILKRDYRGGCCTSLFVIGSIVHAIIFVPLLEIHARPLPLGRPPNLEVSCVILSCPPAPLLSINGVWVNHDSFPWQILPHMLGDKLSLNKYMHHTRYEAQGSFCVRIYKRVPYRTIIRKEMPERKVETRSFYNKVQPTTAIHSSSWSVQAGYCRQGLT